MNTTFRKGLLTIIILAIAVSAELFLKSCMPVSGMNLPVIDTPLTEAQKHLPGNGLKGLRVAPGLSVETMATEPMLINPTNIDVDEKGRVWVTEAYNYRFAINNNRPRAAGDRILILEDKDGDGRLETSQTFYQGPEVNAPLGICVLGNRVLVSQSPYVWGFYDDDNDGKADRKEIVFQGIGGEQHDHGMHTFTFGPDGKLYFNFGNEGRTLRDKNNKVVLDQDGDEIGPKKYMEGMLFRSDPDGTHVECLGYNFRNPYEAAVDSYGTIWQSDNDDDGNKGVRINYVMEYGNYGYKDEMTRAAWSAARTNLEAEIPQRHWHQNDPGVIPNLLNTGSGSPTGMVIYEGALLPREFQGQMIHAEPGHNVIRAYPVTKNGAGYTAVITNLVSGDKDQWFRPSDVCVAPDGSLIVADWYDPGVGGHRVADLERGRIYRIVPEGMKASYKIPVQDYSTPHGAVVALQSPNLAVRRQAFITLTAMGKKAVPALKKLWGSAPNPRVRARALWVLSKSPQAGEYLAEAISDPNPDLRITGLRAAREVNVDVIKYISKLVNDPDVQVRRECAIALRHSTDPGAAALWAALASTYVGNDKWYLEALGIGADRQWAGFFAAYLKNNADPLATPGGRDIVWRARTASALPYLARLLTAETSPLKYLRALDFYPADLRSQTLLELIANNSEDRQLVTTILKLKLLTAADLSGSPVAQRQLEDVLKASSGTQDFVDLVRHYHIITASNSLLNMVATGAGPGVNAARLLFDWKGSPLFIAVINGADPAKALNVLAALGQVGNTEAIAILSDVAAATSRNYQIQLKAIEILQRKRLPAKFSVAKTPALNLAEILALKANSGKGQQVFLKTCIACHQVNTSGFNFGPNLSEIGAKLPKEGIFDAITKPSAGISFGYETSQLAMKDGATLLGIISSRTETDIEIKYPGGTTQKLKTAAVKTIKELPGSMMPDGLLETMTKQEAADLLEFLASLKKASK